MKPKAKPRKPIKINSIETEEMMVTGRVVSISTTKWAPNSRPQCDHPPSVFETVMDEINEHRAFTHSTDRCLVTVKTNNGKYKRIFKGGKK